MSRMSLDEGWRKEFPIFLILPLFRAGCTFASARSKVLWEERDWRLVGHLMRAQKLCKRRGRTLKILFCYTNPFFTSDKLMNESSKSVLAPYHTQDLPRHKLLGSNIHKRQRRKKEVWCFFLSASLSSLIWPGTVRFFLILMTSKVVAQ